MSQNSSADRPALPPAATIPVAAPEEAAAIAAAIERFLLETAPMPPAPAHAPEPWRRAAMLEAVNRARPGRAHAWVDAEETPETR